MLTRAGHWELLKCSQHAFFIQLWTFVHSYADRGLQLSTNVIQLPLRYSNTVLTGGKVWFCTPKTRLRFRRCRCNTCPFTNWQSNLRQGIPQNSKSPLSFSARYLQATSLVKIPRRDDAFCCWKFDRITYNPHIQQQNYIQPSCLTVIPSVEYL